MTIQYRFFTLVPTLPRGNGLYVIFSPEFYQSLLSTLEKARTGEMAQPGRSFLWVPMMRFTVLSTGARQPVQALDNALYSK